MSVSRTGGDPPAVRPVQAGDRGTAAAVRSWRLPWTCDVQALQAEVRRLGQEHWRTDVNTGYHDGGWSGLALVSAGGDAGRSSTDVHGEPVAGPATPLLAQCPALQAALARWPFAIASAWLLRLAPGSHTHEHRDHGLGRDAGLVRLYLPIVTADGVEFCLDGVRVPMREGECWYLDSGLPDPVQNPGAQAFVFLVVDCAVDATVRATLPGADEGERQPRTLACAGAERSSDRFERFRALVLRRADLQRRLLACDDGTSFAALVARVGAETGLAFTDEDVRSALQAGRRAWIERGAGAAARSVSCPPRSAADDCEAGAQLDGWLPVLAEARGERLWLELCRIGDRRFVEPFFEDSVGACMRQPFHLLFRRREEAADLARWLEDHPPIEPSGFVFHMSRCGSTLLSQVLAASPQHRVLSEPGPLDAAVRSGAPARGDRRRIDWVRTAIGMLGQPGSADERRLYVKFDSCHALELAVIRRAYPDVPWVFLVRDPVEVIVSHLHSPAAQMVPGMIGFAPTGVDLARAVSMSREEYCARMLGDICAAALAEFERDPARGLVVDYRDLRAALRGPLPRHLGVPDLPAERAALDEVLRRNATNPAREFVPDVDAKQDRAGAAVRRAAERWVQPAYLRLRALAERGLRPAPGSPGAACARGPGRPGHAGADRARPRP